jgi:hypothetical protein
MESRRQSKARNAVTVRTETLTFRLSKRLRSLAEIAARSKGVTLANYVESVLETSLTEPMEFLKGASIAEKAEDLHDDDPAMCFLKRIYFPWAMTREQKRLLDLVRTSKVLYPQWDVFNVEFIQQHWDELLAIAEGTDDPRALPPEIFDGVDIEFALMSDTDRIALYQKDPEGCAERTQAYMNCTKRTRLENVG